MFRGVLMALGVCAAFGAAPARAAVIDPLSNSFTYFWQADAEAFLGNNTQFFPGTFREIATSCGSAVCAPVTSSNDPLHRPHFQGGTQSPIPGKLYDNLPFLVQQPDGSFADQYSHTASWTGASASVDYLPGRSASGGLKADVFSSATASASVRDADSLTIGRASAHALMQLETRFRVQRGVGEADRFDLSLTYQADFGPADVGPPFPSPWFTDNEYSIQLIDVSTGAVLFYADETAAQFLTPRSSVIGFGAATGLNYGDEYLLRILVETEAEAESSSELILGEEISPGVFAIEGIDQEFGFDPSSTNLHLTINPIARVAAVPEPATLALLTAGLLGLGLRRWVKR